MNVETGEQLVQAVEIGVGLLTSAQLLHLMNLLEYEYINRMVGNPDEYDPN